MGGGRERTWAVCVCACTYPVCMCIHVNDVIIRQKRRSGRTERSERYYFTDNNAEHSHAFRQFLITFRLI